MRRTLKHICEHCGKGVQYAHLVSHAKNRVRKIKKPNLHHARVMEAGLVVRRRLCTKCLRAAQRPPRPSESVQPRPEADQQGTAAK